MVPGERGRQGIREIAVDGQTYDRQDKEQQYGRAEFRRPPPVLRAKPKSIVTPTPASGQRAMPLFTVGRILKKYPKIEPELLDRI